tara:strand:+ start:169 stop:597 length:429 start_codon:yes stop_codon:yes gene_type:complete
MDKQSLRPFHLAFPVQDLEEAKEWYVNILGCSLGRQSNDWVDFNFFGHQVVAHLANDINITSTNQVDRHNVPCRHFGIILTPSEWKLLVSSLENKHVDFEINPYTRFKGEPGEQHTLFIKDPSGNFLEFKAFENDDNIFSTI